MNIVLSGPSGVGKSFLCKDISRYYGFYIPKKHTTRLKRPKEDETEYYFVSKDVFTHLLKTDMFAVSTTIYGNDYGLSHEELEHSDNNILVLDAFLAQKFKQKYTDTVIVFILPPDIEQLKDKLYQRKILYNEEVSERILLLEEEIVQSANFDYIIPRINSEVALELLKSIILSNICKVVKNDVSLNNYIYSCIKTSPRVAVDAVIINKITKSILLVERLKEPVGWALPGGFVECGETVEEALQREVFEEVGINISSHKMIGVFSARDRDPRMHVISIAFLVTVEDFILYAGGDAKQSEWYVVNNLPTDIAFDHKDIINLGLALL